MLKNIMNTSSGKMKNRLITTCVMCLIGHYKKAVYGPIYNLANSVGSVIIYFVTSYVIVCN